MYAGQSEIDISGNSAPKLETNAAQNYRASQGRVIVGVRPDTSRHENPHYDVPAEAEPTKFFRFMRGEPVFALKDEQDVDSEMPFTVARTVYNGVSQDAQYHVVGFSAGDFDLRNRSSDAIFPCQTSGTISTQNKTGEVWPCGTRLIALPPDYDQNTTRNNSGQLRVPRLTLVLQPVQTVIADTMRQLTAPDTIGNAGVRAIVTSHDIRSVLDELRRGGINTAAALQKYNAVATQVYEYLNGLVCCSTVTAVQPGGEGEILIGR